MRASQLKYWFYGALAILMTRFAVLAAVLLAGCLYPRPSDTDLRMVAPPRSAPAHLSKPDSALAHLARVESFSTYHAGLVDDAGFRGTAFRTIAGAPEAAALFSRLLAAESPAVQLYGLAGLRAVDPEGYRAILPEYLARADSVDAMYGCFILHLTVSDVARDIESGEIVADLTGTLYPAL